MKHFEEKEAFFISEAEDWCLTKDAALYDQAHTSGLTLQVVQLPPSLRAPFDTWGGFVTTRVVTMGPGL